MKARDVREMTDEELQVQLKQRRDSLMTFRMQSATGVVDNVRAARNARRDIARILTIMRERATVAKGSR